VLVVRVGHAQALLSLQSIARIALKGERAFRYNAVSTRQAQLGQENKMPHVQSLFRVGIESITAAVTVLNMF